MHIKYNVPLIYAISALSWGRFFIPVLALFYISSQVPIEQFTIIMSVFSLTILLLEVPTGVLADLIGKKKTIMLSKFCYIFEILILAFSNGFWPFLIAKIISGIGVSLASGTDSAFLYDTLKRMKKEKDFKKISGTKLFITNISMAIVFITGAYLFSINNKLPAKASLLPILLTFTLTFFLEEPYKPEKKPSLKNAIIHLIECLKHSWKHDTVRYLIFFSIPVFAVIQVIQGISSAYLKEILIPITLIGAVAFITSMTTAITAKKAHSLERQLGDKKSMLLIQTLMLAGTLLMALMMPYLGALFYLIIAFASGFFQILIEHYMNVHIETSHRATILSIKNMLNELGLFILYPIAGYVIKIKSMQASFTFLAVFFAVYAIILYLYSRTLKIGELNTT